MKRAEKADPMIIIFREVVMGTELKKDKSFKEYWHLINDF